MMSKYDYECLQEITRLNNQGARCLASNDGGRAVKSFKAALVIMEGIAESAEMMVEGNGKTPVVPSVKVPGLEDNFFVYNRALFLEASDSGIDLVATNAIILFNLALAFHQKGHSCSQEAKLQKALQLYGLCTRLSVDVSSPIAGPVVLAALNNQAQIHFRLYNYGKVEEVFNSIRSIAEHVPMTSAFEERDFQEIYLNVAITQEPVAAASA